MGLPSLAATQLRLQQLITAPDGVGRALEDEGDPAGASLTGLLRDDGRLGVVPRLDVYANAYFYRILECLQSDYGALQAAIGEDWFHDLVTAYLIARPSRYPSLRQVGEALADFLVAAPEAEPFRERWPWAADLARLEWGLLEAFDAADAAEIPRAELAALAPDAWAALRFHFQASLRLLALDWPVHELRRRHDREEPPLDAPLLSRATRILVWRQHERVFHRALEAAEWELLTWALDGACFGDLCEQIAREEGEEAAPGRAAALLARWQADGLLAGLETRG